MPECREDMAVPPRTSDDRDRDHEEDDLAVILQRRRRFRRRERPYHVWVRQRVEGGNCEHRPGPPQRERGSRQQGGTRHHAGEGLGDPRRRCGQGGKQGKGGSGGPSRYRSGAETPVRGHSIRAPATGPTS